jgi:hypothetical protein
MNPLVELDVLLGFKSHTLDLDQVVRDYVEHSVGFLVERHLERVNFGDHPANFSIQFGIEHGLRVDGNGVDVLLEAAARENAVQPRTELVVTHGVGSDHIYEQLGRIETLILSVESEQDFTRLLVDLLETRFLDRTCV